MDETARIGHGREKARLYNRDALPDDRQPVRVEAGGVEPVLIEEQKISVGNVTCAAGARENLVDIAGLERQDRCGRIVDDSAEASEEHGLAIRQSAGVNMASNV